MPRTVTIEELPEFSARHGGNPLLIGQYFVFEDGARIHRMGERHEPPANDYERLLLQKAYVTAKLKNEESDFDRHRRYWLSLAENVARFGHLAVPGPPVDAPQQLERGRQRILALRQRLEQIDAAIGLTAEAVQQQRQAVSEQERQQALRDQIRRIGSVQI